MPINEETALWRGDFHQPGVLVPEISFDHERVGECAHGSLRVAEDNAGCWLARTRPASGYLDPRSLATDFSSEQIPSLRCAVYCVIRTLQSRRGSSEADAMLLCFRVFIIASQGAYVSAETEISVSVPDVARESNLLTDLIASSFLRCMYCVLNASERSQPDG